MWTVLHWRSIQSGAGAHALQRVRLDCQFFDEAIAVCEFLHVDTNAVEQREVEVGEWRHFIELDVAIALYACGAATSDEDREVAVIVFVEIPHAAAVQVERVIQEGAVSVGRGIQFLQVLGEERDVEGIDLGHASDLVRIVAMMAERVVWIRDPNLRIGSIASLTSKLEGDDAGKGQSPHPIR